MHTFHSNKQLCRAVGDGTAGVAAVLPVFSLLLASAHVHIILVLLLLTVTLKSCCW